jgi:hypothetical protein
MSYERLEMPEREFDRRLKAMEALKLGGTNATMQGVGDKPPALASPSNERLWPSNNSVIDFSREID